MGSTTHVFVTGGTGLIGRALVERLLRRGLNVTLMLRSGSAERRKIELEALDRVAGGANGSLNHVTGDLGAAGLGLVRSRPRRPVQSAALLPPRRTLRHRRGPRRPRKDQCGRHQATAVRASQGGLRWNAAPRELGCGGWGLRRDVHRGHVRRGARLPARLSPQQARIGEARSRVGARLPNLPAERGRR